MSDIRRLIEEFAKHNDIIFGICDADDLVGLDESILCIPFFKGDFRDRISPSAFLNGAKSVIVLGAKVDMTPIFEGLNQVMAPSMSGVDYHIRLKAITNDLISKLKECAEFDYKVQIDTGPLIERAFAIKAGLGFRGKNGCVINPVFGSFFNIALIVTTLDIKTKLQSSTLSCHLCNKCVNICPSNAINDNGVDYASCISFLTQKSGELTQKESDLIVSSIYGCDLCQSICPYNTHYNFKAQKENARYALEKILNMSNKEFSDTFKNSNLFWRGKTTIQRNCSISIKNL